MKIDENISTPRLKTMQAAIQALINYTRSGGNIMADFQHLLNEYVKEG